MRYTKTPNLTYSEYVIPALGTPGRALHLDNDRDGFPKEEGHVFVTIVDDNFKAVSLVRLKLTDLLEVATLLAKEELDG